MSKITENQALDQAEIADAPAPEIPADPEPRGGQERVMTDEEEMDEALDETFPASDPIAPSRIDGPGN